VRWWSWPVVVLAAGAVLAGCTVPLATVKPEPERPARVADDEDDDRPVAVRVYYATDRKASLLAEADEIYGGERGDLALGVCDLAAPAERLIDPDSKNRFTIEALTDRLDRLTLRAVQPLPRTDFFARLQLDVQAAPRNDAFVFIHGYNVPFAAAARRAAQIAHDMGFDGVPVLYSWPSRGKLVDYTVDENNVEWTVPHLARFLADLAVQSGAERLHLVAHSMGTRALAGALRDLAAARPGERPFAEVVLAAPDIDAEVFRRDVVPRLLAIARHITLYASSEDDALTASRKVHGYLRAGESGDGLLVMAGIDTVDASTVGASGLGHSYYGDSRQVIMDLRRLLMSGESVSERDLLPLDHAGGTYWTFPED